MDSVHPAPNPFSHRPVTWLQLAPSLQYPTQGWLHLIPNHPITHSLHTHTHTHKKKQEQIKQIKTCCILLNKIYGMWLNILNSLKMWLNIFKMTKKQNLLTKWHVSVYYMWTYFYCNIFHSNLVYTKNTFRFVCDTCCSYN